MTQGYRGCTHAVCLLGSPGSGKDAQAEMLVVQYGACHVNIGEILRRMAKDPAHSVYQTMKSGLLVDDDMINEIFDDQVQKHLDSPLMIVNGAFRTYDQALPQIDSLRSNGITKIDFVHLHTSMHIAQERLELARNERLAQGRPDTDPAAIEKRLEYFKSHTLPAIEWLAQLKMPGVSFHTIDGNLSLMEVQKCIVALVQAANVSKFCQASYRGLVVS